MSSEPEERKRILGFPVGPDPYGPRPDEQRRISGLPVGSIGPVDTQWFRSLLHPVRSVKRWNRYRALGPFALDDDEMGGDETTHQ
jgi:hypothetical protein